MKMNRLVLFAPEVYWNLSEKDHKRLCNGCGPAGWMGIFVPNTVCFLDISKACDIHDYMYYAGKTQKDKEEADRAFLNNMKRMINFHTEYKWLIHLRYRRANFNYKMVHENGGPYFWTEDKNKPDDMKEIV